LDRCEGSMLETGESSTIAPPPRRSPRCRAGCTILTILWFLLLLTPCVGIVLATQGDIVIPQGSVPGHEIRIWLISEADQRGLGLSSATIDQTNSNALCVETSARFILWTGNAAPLTSCVCYTRDSEEQAWSTISVENRACESDG
jgi:hypothetical protein